MWKAVVLGAVLIFSVAAVAHAMDLDDVERMLQAGIGEDVVLKALDASRSQFVVTSDDLVALKEAGASDWFLDQLLDRNKQQQRTYDVSGSAYSYSGPSRGYVSIGLAYDPFDYYFASYPYYYAYCAPWSFSWNWWYYGGPYHRAWWEPSGGHRNRYYNTHWGTRSIWERGYRNGIRYHVPGYAPIGKDVAYQRPPTDRRAWGRSMSGEKPSNPGAWNRGNRSGDKQQDRHQGQPPAWGRQDRPTRNPAPPRQPDAPSRTQSPDRSTNPSSPPNRNAPPSAPPRNLWSR